MTPANVVAYCAQVALIVIVCAGLPRLLGLRVPTLQYAFWRTLFAACLILPAVQPWLPGQVPFVPAPPSSTAPSPMAVPHRETSPAVQGNMDWTAAARVVLIGGMSVRLAWIALGMVRLRRMRHRATDAAVGFDDLQQTIAVRVPILWSADARHPVTFGVWDPVILLPAALKAVDLPAQRAVVAHELHHVKRRDWAWVVAEEIVRSVFWFHPAMWWLISRVQLARETVVDELSIMVTNARRTYLDTLLAFADDSGLASSAAFSARRHLFHRVMLLSKEAGMSSIRIAVASLVLVAALGASTVGAVTVFPLYGAAQAGQELPPRDPLKPETYHRMAQDYLERAMKDTTLSPEQKLQAILKGIAAEDRALALNPSHVDALIYKNLLLRMQAELTGDPQQREALVGQADELRNKAVELRKASGMPGMAASPGAAAPMPAGFKALLDQLKPLKVGGDIRAPRKIRDVKPAFPDEARAAAIQGVVILEIIVDQAGTVADARILRSIPGLDDAALSAVRQWMFAPTVVDGAQVPLLMTVTVNFTLQ